jgi:hypothetical protein
VGLEAARVAELEQVAFNSDRGERYRHDHSARAEDHPGSTFDQSAAPRGRDGRGALHDHHHA